MAKAKKKAAPKRRTVTKRATGDKNTGLISVAFRIKPTYHRTITRAALKAQQTLNDWCIEATKAYLERQGETAANGEQQEASEAA